MLVRTLTLDESLLALRPSVSCLLLVGGLAAGLAQGLRRLLLLGVSDGLICDGCLAVAGLSLLELSLLHQFVLAAEGTGHFLSLACDAVEQSLAGL
jgi:hypothetical protein